MEPYAEISCFRFQIKAATVLLVNGPMFSEGMLTKRLNEPATKCVPFAAFIASNHSIDSIRMLRLVWLGIMPMGLEQNFISDDYPSIH